MAMPEHEVLTFSRVKGILEDSMMNSGMYVKSTGPLAEALRRLGCFPYTKIPCDSFNAQGELSIRGKPAGRSTNLIST
jgi:hypothetical protein